MVTILNMLFTLKQNQILPTLILMLTFNMTYANKMCTYQTYSWNTHLKKAVDFQTVKKPYSSLTANEKDLLTGCTVCEEDQREIKLESLKTFKLCHVLADRISTLLKGLIEQGEPIYSVIGYRVGNTRGDINLLGLRTKFSNHSFGIALDINSQQNGLYGNCIDFSDSCRLLRGGDWKPGRRGVMTKDGVIVRALKNISFKWGGEIQGYQKDFMHFSPTGY